MNGIEMNVAAKPVQIDVSLNRDCQETTLHQMPCMSVPQVIKDRMRSLNFVHERRQVASRRLDEQVKMVAHQAEEVESNPAALNPIGQPIEKVCAVAIIVKDRSALHTSCRDVVDCSGKLYPQLSSHSKNSITSAEQPQ
jgi:hypothetical protein